jgi:transposase
MDQLERVAEQIARKYGVWIIVGLMLLEIGLQWRRNQRESLGEKVGL